MPKSSAIIGRVAVKVLPDTDSFRSDAQKQLNAIEKELEPIKVQLVPDIDLEEVKSQARRAREVAQAELREITLNVKVDTNNVSRDLANMNNSLDNLDNTRTIHVGDEISDIQFSIDETSKRNALLEILAFRTELKRDMTVRVDFEIDSASKAKALAELAVVSAEVHDMTADIRVDVDGPSKLKSDVELAELAHGRSVSFRPEVDNAAFVKVASALAILSGAHVYSLKIEGVADLLGSLDTMVPKLGGVAVGVAQITSAAFAGAGDILSLAGGLSELSGFAFALPGVFTGLAIGLGLTSIALKDMKKALPDVYAEWQNVKDTITKDFWSGAGTGIRELANVYMPQLEGTAKAVGTFWGDLAHSLAQPLQTALPGMFQNLNDSIAITASHTGSFAGIITTLGTVGSAQLPRLATFVGDVGDKFNTWLAAKQATGELQGYIDTAIQALKDLGNIIVQAGRIFGGLMAAASAGGGATLASLGDGLKSIADTINSPAFQAALIGTFQAAHDAISNLAQTAGPAFKNLLLTLAQTLQFILPMVGSAVGTLVSGLATALADPAIQQGLQSFFIGLSGAVKELSPAFVGLAQGIGPILGLLGQFADTLAPIFVGAMQAIGPLVNALIGPISSLSAMLGSVFANVLSQLEPIILQVAQAFGSFMTNGGIDAISQILGALAPVAITLAGAFAQLFTAGLKAIQPILPVIAQAFSDIFAAVGPVINQLVSALLPVLPVIANAFSIVIQALAPLIPILLNALAPVIPVIANLLAQLAPVLAVVAQTLAGALAPVLPIIANLFVTLVSALAPVIPILVGALAPILPVLAAAIGQIVAAVTPLIPLIVNLLMAAIMPLVPLFLQLVTAIIPPLAAIITQLAAALAPLIEALTTVVQIIMPILLPILGMLADVLIGAVMGALNGIVNMITGLIDIFSGIIDFVVGVFTGNWSQAWDGIKEIFQGVFEFIGGLIQFVWNVIILATFFEGMGAIKNLWEVGWGAIKGVFEPIWGGIQTLIDVVWTIIKDLWSGSIGELKAGWEMLWGFIKSAFEPIWTGVKQVVSDVWEAVKGFFTDGTGSIQKLWETVWGKIKDFFTTAWGGIKQAVSDGVNAVVQFFKDLPGNILKAVDGLVDKLTTFGGNLLQGLWKGISGMSSWLMGRIGSFFGDLLPGWVKDMLGIRSPSRVFAEIGSWLLPGLAMGMTSDSSLTSVKDAVGVMHDTLTTPIDTGILYDSGEAITGGLLDGMESQYDTIKKSLTGLGGDLAKTDISPVLSTNVSGKVGSAVGGSSVAASAGGNTLIYNAAPGNSISAEEDLFRAASRARMGW
jgi:phage-related protein